VRLKAALNEIFLVLSSMGTAFRRCELAWVNGNEVGVYFLKPGEKTKKRARPAAHAPAVTAN
jgi:hypothetical protein